jgi:hypothetical protein
MANPLTDLLKAETMASPAESPTPVRGTGGGLSDLVPAEIDGSMPAALSEGEFVFPADVVSMLGDGSSEAGARVLDRLINEIRGIKQGGDTKQAKSIIESLGV